MKKFFYNVILVSFFIVGMYPLHFGQTSENSTFNENVVFSTYLGGTSDELAETNAALSVAGIVVDSDGSTIIVGRTGSTNFSIKNAFQANHSGGSKDIIIAKFSQNGSLMFSTYFGGSSDDWAANVVTDSDNNIYVVGTTVSDDLPTSSNAFQSEFAGGRVYHTDAFIVKLSPDGQDLLYCSYFGGSGDDWGYGIDVDSQNNVGICGSTYSDDLQLVNAYQESIGSTTAVDAYIASINIEERSLQFSSYLGDLMNDWAKDLVFDSEDNAIIVGGSMSEDFPTKSAYKGSLQGMIDVICAKFSSTGSLVFSTFIGGGNSDLSNCVAIDDSGNIIIGGSTQSEDFPVKNAYQNSLAGIEDAFIMKLSSNGRTVRFSTYFGGSNMDSCSGIAADPNGNIVLTGKTSSRDFPIVNATQSDFKGGSNDAFYAIFGGSGENLQKSSYFGGNAYDVGQSVAVSPLGRISIVGYTKSTDISCIAAAQSECRGSNDYFVTSISYDSSVIDSSSKIPGFASILPISFIAIGGVLINNKEKK
ncbi:hypothetical protein NEF87_001527 [Candidatus Lokiarchaeum ossiferum]|uniref:Beta-propeller repeat protein n=1 Tax=Candidatus Lokiarchaeum ossiferum TaxID=2951803 RepID=A0ABY6HP13_9ARCH|nr:hypothetical protein NEF87_001527 [Candidatus Lokiarchaeum sp. B-35]